MAMRATKEHSGLRQAPLAAALCALLATGAVPASNLQPHMQDADVGASLQPIPSHDGVADIGLESVGASTGLVPSSVTTASGAVEQDEADRWPGNRSAWINASGNSVATANRGSYALRVVYNCNDSGSGSLREAIEGSTGQSTVVEFDNQLDCSTITLTSGAIQASMENLNIHGPGAPPFGDITIVADSGDADRNRIIRHTGDGTLEINRVSMRDGSYAEYTGHDVASGGCLYSLGHVDLSQLSISGCSAISDWIADGGAVWAYEGINLLAVTITNSLALSIDDDDASIGGNGGAVFTHGNFRAVATTRIASNVAGGYGGGVHASGRVTVEGSTFAGNEAKYGAGGGLHFDGIENSSFHSVISQSTFSGNAAERGGAIYFAADISPNTIPLDLVNSTISGNQADDVVGGVFIDAGTLYLSNSTIAFNTAANSATTDAGEAYAGLHLQSGFGDIQSTIISNNTAGEGVPADASSTLFDVTGADNLIMASTPNFDGIIIALDPLLLPLRDNGGNTETHALAQGSLAIDHGNNTASLSNDQRGLGNDFPRVAGPATDIGAFEKQGPFDGDRIFADGFE